MYTVIEQITPDYAKHLLSLSKGNRNISQSHVAWLSELMASGQFKLTHQGIAIDKNNVLIDGHHRLIACVKSNTTISLSVTYGVEEIYHYLDQGKNRCMQDLLSIDVRLSEECYFFLHFGLMIRKPSPDDIEKWCLNEGSLIVDTHSKLIDHCPTKVKIYTSAPMRTAAICQMILNPDSRRYVLEQYMALARFNIPMMSQSSQSLVTKIQKIGNYRLNKPDLFVSGMKVFDQSKKDNKKVVVLDNDLDAIRQTLVSVIDLSLKGNAK